MIRRLVAALVLVAAGTALARAQTKPAGPEKPQPVTPEEIEKLRREIEQETRSSLDLFFDGHTENGDLNNKLSDLRFGARLNLKRGSATTLRLAAFHTPYTTSDSVVQESGTGLALGASSRPSERLDYEWEVGALYFSDETWNGTGRVKVELHPSEGFRYSVGVSRSLVEQSMLSAVGLHPVLGPFAGERVGAVTDNRLSAGATWQLPLRFDVVAEGALGVYTGHNVGTNFFKRFGGGPAWNAIARAPDQPVSLFRLGVWFEYLGFDEDRLGYGGASLLDASGQPVPLSALGSDGIPPDPAPPHPGVGGYFSPRTFTSTVARVELRGRGSAGFDYSLTAFLGTQSYTGSERRGAGGVAAALTLRARERFSVPLTYSLDNYGPFTQQTLQARLVLRF
jgi:cellulose synthase operon protein C